jgi:hypothetical protein
MKKIAPRPDTPRQVVSKWRKRFHEQRLPNLPICPGEHDPLSPDDPPDPEPSPVQ